MVSTQPVTQPSAAGPSFPGARRPDRTRSVDSHGLRLAVYEWGDEAAPPILFAHGGFDFAGTYDTLAPLVADGGWRVVSWDQRGHGDSDHAELYSWEADQRDALAVLDSIGREPIPVLGHSKGGGLLLNVADALPAPREPPHQPRRPAVAPRLARRLRARPHAAARQRAHRVARPPAFRGRRHPQAGHHRGPGRAARSHEPPHVARVAALPRADRGWESDDGWRWKIDPSMRLGGFGPWRPEWSMMRLPGLGMPVLGVLGLEREVMGWGTLPEDVVPYLPAGARFVPLEGVGHFVHIEQPRLIADLVLEFLS